MDSNSGEDFVHVENSLADSLSESIVNVKREEAEEAENDDDVSTSAAAAVTEEEQGRKVLPEELSKSVVVLTCESTAASGVCDVHVVGTAHVSVVM